MASRFVKSPVVQTTAKRQYAAQAVAKTEHVVPKPEALKVSTLKNGVIVASIENHGPVTSLGVVVKAGSRNESYENSGISHMLRVSAGLATKNNTAFGITRNLQQAGTGLVCTQGREHTLYSVQVGYLLKLYSSLLFPDFIHDITMVDQFMSPTVCVLITNLLDKNLTLARHLSAIYRSLKYVHMFVG